MTDEQTTEETPTITEPKTVADAEIETLKKQIADMQSKYDSMIAEYQAENRRLYNHAIGNETPTVTEPVKPVYDINACESAFYQTLGIERK